MKTFFLGFFFLISTGLLAQEPLISPIQNPSAPQVQITPRGDFDFNQMLENARNNANSHLDGCPLGPNLPRWTVRNLSDFPVALRYNRFEDIISLTFYRNTLSRGGADGQDIAPFAPNSPETLVRSYVVDEDYIYILSTKPDTDIYLYQLNYDLEVVSKFPIAHINPSLYEPLDIKSLLNLEAIGKERKIMVSLGKVGIFSLARNGAMKFFETNHIQNPADILDLRNEEIAFQVSNIPGSRLKEFGFEEKYLADFLKMGIANPNISIIAGKLGHFDMVNFGNQEVREVLLSENPILNEYIKIINTLIAEDQTFNSSEHKDFLTVVEELFDSSTRKGETVNEILNLIELNAPDSSGLARRIISRDMIPNLLQHLARRNEENATIIIDSVFQRSLSPQRLREYESRSLEDSIAALREGSLNQEWNERFNQYLQENPTLEGLSFRVLSRISGEGMISLTVRPDLSSESRLRILRSMSELNHIRFSGQIARALNGENTLNREQAEALLDLIFSQSPFDRNLISLAYWDIAEGQYADLLMDRIEDSLLRGDQLSSDTIQTLPMERVQNILNNPSLPERGKARIRQALEAMRAPDFEERRRSIIELNRNSERMSGYYE